MLTNKRTSSTANLAPRPVSVVRQRTAVRPTPSSVAPHPEAVARKKKAVAQTVAASAAPAAAAAADATPSFAELTGPGVPKLWFTQPLEKQFDEYASATGYTQFSTRPHNQVGCVSAILIPPIQNVWSHHPLFQFVEWIDVNSCDTENDIERSTTKLAIRVFWQCILDCIGVVCTESQLPIADLHAFDANAVNVCTVVKSKVAHSARKDGSDFWAAYGAPASETDAKCRAVIDATVSRVLVEMSQEYEIPSAYCDDTWKVLQANNRVRDFTWRILNWATEENSMFSELGGVTAASGHAEHEAHTKWLNRYYNGDFTGRTVPLPRDSLTAH